MDPQELRRLVRKWAVLVVVLAVAGAAASYAISTTLTPIYQSEGRLLVLAAPQQQTAGGVLNATTSQVTSTYASLMTTTPVINRVIKDLNLPETAEQLTSHISVTPERDTQILQIAVKDPSATRARDIADTLMTDFLAQVSKQHQDQINQATADLRAQIKSTQDDLNGAQQSLASTKPGADNTALTERVRQDHDLLNQLLVASNTSSASQLRSQDNVTLASPASLPTSPASPRVLLNTVLGAFGGLLAGIGLVFLSEYLDQGLRSEEDVRRRLGLTTLGVVPNFSVAKGKSAGGRRRNEQAAEAFRRLRTNLRFCAVDREIKSVVITSSRQGEGKTSTSANLARMVAASGQHVVLVDADMRRPSQHVLFSKPLINGMSELLLQATRGIPPSVNGSHTTQYRNLTLVTAGVIPPNPAELLASRYAPEALRHLEATSDLVVIDTPPVGVVTDALGLAATADATVLVVKAGCSARHTQRTIDALRRVGANVVGVVLNRARDDKAAGYYYYEGHYQSPPAASESGGFDLASGLNGEDANGAWSPITRQPDAPPPGTPAERAR